MNPSKNETEPLQDYVTRFANGDDLALNELLKRSSERLEQLTRAMFRDFSRVHRWEETADVLQSASIRLYRALQATRPKSMTGDVPLISMKEEPCHSLVDVVVGWGLRFRRRNSRP